MIEPLISIFLPTHSRFKSGLLAKSVESVLAQTYKNFELLVVDDASTDGAAHYIDEVSKNDSRIKCIRFEKNIGLPALTLAQAYLQSRGDYLAFAFDDTEWFSNHLETLMSCLQKHPDAGMVYGGVRIDLPGVPSQVLGMEEYDLQKLLEYNYIGNCGVILKRSTVEQVGWYDPHILVKRCCDWDLWLRIGKKKISVVYCPEIIAHERGAVQNDSIGSSVSLYDSLTRKYQDTQRNHLLAPQLIAQGKAPMFGAFEWMTKKETEELRILVFEHYLRTLQINEVTQLSKAWLSESEVVGNNLSEVSDIESLAKAFNLYLAATRYSCRGTCESAYKLSEVASANNTMTICYSQLNQYYDQLKNEFEQMIDKYCRLDDEYHRVLGSLSWRLTKITREFKKVCRSNKHIYKIAKTVISPARGRKIG